MNLISGYIHIGDQSGLSIWGSLQSHLQCPTLQAARLDGRSRHLSGIHSAAAVCDGKPLQGAYIGGGARLTLKA